MSPFAQSVVKFAFKKDQLNALKVCYIGTWKNSNLGELANQTFQWKMVNGCIRYQWNFIQIYKLFNLSIIRCRACSTGFPVFSDQIRLSFSNMSGLLAATVDEYNQIMAFMDFCKKAISPDFKFFFHLRASRTFDKFVCIARWKFLNFLPEDALEGKLNRKLGLVGFSPNSFGSILLNQVMLSFNYRLPSNSHKIPKANLISFWVNSQFFNKPLSDMKIWYPSRASLAEVRIRKGTQSDLMMPKIWFSFATMSMELFSSMDI